MVISDFDLPQKYDWLPSHAVRHTPIVTPQQHINHAIERSLDLFRQTSFFCMPINIIRKPRRDKRAKFIIYWCLINSQCISSTTLTCFARDNGSVLLVLHIEAAVLLLWKTTTMTTRDGNECHYKWRSLCHRILMWAM